ncbi:MAG: glycosyltransferase family 39 protein [Gammaproteobacteria bacterium]|nr:glycosyltransferase family 39 protein [Gammaproteobacteria bacterium]
MHAARRVWMHGSKWMQSEQQPKQYRSRIIHAMLTTEYRDLRLFWGVAFVLLAAGIGLRDPWPADEPRFVLVAQQMWDSGEWLFPHRGRELYPDKPPLYFWLLGAAYALVRDWTWTFLLPSLLAALGTLALTYDLGRRLWAPRTGLWAAVAVLCTAQFVYQAKRAQIDPTVTLFITLGVYGIARHTLLGPHWRWYWLGCFAAGLGVITNGVGFIALLALLPYAAMRWRRWPGVIAPGPGHSGHWALGAVAFFAAIALWFVPMLITALTSGDPEHRAYLDELLFRQTATRYTAAWHHQQPPWYYLGVIAGFWLPFSLALPWLLPHWRAAWRARDARVWLPLGWALLVLLFFSASPGKRDMYILPMLPMVALAAAPYLERITRSALLRALLLALVAVLAVVLAAGGIAALATEPGFELKIEAERGLDATTDQLWWLLAALGAAMVLVLLILRRHVLRAVAVALALLVVVLFSGTALLLDDENSARGVMLRARAMAGAHTQIGLVGWREQNLLQAQGPTVEFGFKRTPGEQLAEGIAWLRAAPHARQLFVLDEAIGSCVRRDLTRPVGTANRRHWLLVPAAALRADCPPDQSRP